MIRKTYPISINDSKSYLGSTEEFHPNNDRHGFFTAPRDNFLRYEQVISRGGPEELIYRNPRWNDEAAFYRLFQCVNQTMIGLYGDPKTSVYPDALIWELSDQIAANDNSNVSQDFIKAGGVSLPRNIYQLLIYDANVSTSGDGRLVFDDLVQRPMDRKYDYLVGALIHASEPVQAALRATQGRKYKKPNLRHEPGAGQKVYNTVKRDVGDAISGLNSNPDSFRTSANIPPVFEFKPLPHTWTKWETYIYDIFGLNNLEKIRERGTNAVESIFKGSDRVYKTPSTTRLQDVYSFGDPRLFGVPEGVAVEKIYDVARRPISESIALSAETGHGNLNQGDTGAGTVGDGGGTLEGPVHEGFEFS